MRDRHTPHSSLLTSTSSGTPTNADLAWLSSRLGEVPDGLTAGLASDLGIDMTAFEDDGYMIRTDKSETVVAAKTADGLDRALRRYAKAYEKGEVSDVTYHEGYRVKKITIAGADISEFTVVRPADANENVDFAISELTRLVEKATGVKLPVAQSASGHKITFTLSDDAKYEEDGYTYEVKGGDLNFTGAVERGAMNGVWRFLEKELDWNGLMFGDSVLAEAAHVDIPDGTNRSETPAFTFYDPYRNHYRSYINDSTPPSFAQSSYGPITKACHGIQSHAFCDEDYHSRQICYTSEARYEECLENVTAYIEREIDAGNEPGKGLKYIDIAQGDTETFCNCKDCRAVFKEEGGNAGAMLRFSNRLADEINGTYHGIYFLVFAYAGTNVAPLITRPNEWIYVTFCFDGNCTNHKIDGSECTEKIGLGNREKRDNALYVEWLKGWTALTDNVYVWYYALNQGFKQYNVFRTLLCDMQFLRDCGVKGIFWEAESCGFGISYVEHMTAFELNWNLDISDAEYEAVIARVLEKEFGDGWKNVREYLAMQTEAQDLMGCWDCWNQQNRYFDECFYGAHFEESVDLIDETVQLANSALQEMQAVMYSIHVLFQGAYVGYHSAYLADDTEKIAYWCSVYDEMIRRLALYGYSADELPYGNNADFYESDLVTQAWKQWTKGFDAYYSDFRSLDCPIELD